VIPPRIISTPGSPFDEVFRHVLCFGGEDVLHQISLAEALQSSRREDDGIVIALLKFVQTRIDVAAQGMNVEIRADGFDLRLPAQAGCADARALGQVFDLRILT